MAAIGTRCLSISVVRRSGGAAGVVVRAGAEDGVEAGVVGTGGEALLEPLGRSSLIRSSLP
ncbi:MAG TPA: hypothetical protein VGQ47_03155 [Candidatus Limnocylindrales bacterium]|nr:hypothetical protein [Candidatus Limnocylindrales bacterium]